MTERAATAHDVQAILERISFAPSCIDMGWEWEVENLYDEGGAANGFHLLGWNIQTTFRRPDTATGEVGTGRGRSWFISKGSTADGIIKTAYLAMQQILTHELMEAFLVDEVRVFNPHAAISDLVELHRG